MLDRITDQDIARTDNGIRVNDNVSNGIVLTNTDDGYFYSTTFKLEYPFKKGLWGSFAYTHSAAYDLMSPGSMLLVHGQVQNL